MFLHYFRQYLNELVNKYLFAQVHRLSGHFPEDFLRNHISGSFVNMVQWWIEGGMKESPEQLADWFADVIEPVIDQE